MLTIWALKKRPHLWHAVVLFGTATSHRVVERAPAGIRWPKRLQEQPGVEIITRDRGQRLCGRGAQRVPRGPRKLPIAFTLRQNLSKAPRRPSSTISVSFEVTITCANYFYKRWSPRRPPRLRCRIACPVQPNGITGPVAAAESQLSGLVQALRQEGSFLGEHCV